MAGLLSSFKFFGHLGDITESFDSAPPPPVGFTLTYDFSASSGNGFYNVMIFG